MAKPMKLFHTQALFKYALAISLGFFLYAFNGEEMKVLISHTIQAQEAEKEHKKEQLKQHLQEQLDAFKVIEEERLEKEDLLERNLAEQRRARSEKEKIELKKQGMKLAQKLNNYHQELKTILDQIEQSIKSVRTTLNQTQQRDATARLLARKQLSNKLAQVKEELNNKDNKKALRSLESAQTSYSSWREAFLTWGIYWKNYREITIADLMKGQTKEEILAESEKEEAEAQLGQLSEEIAALEEELAIITDALEHEFKLAAWESFKTMLESFQIEIETRLEQLQKEQSSLENQKQALDDILQKKTS